MREIEKYGYCFFVIDSIWLVGIVTTTIKDRFKDEGVVSELVNRMKKKKWLNISRDSLVTCFLSFFSLQKTTRIVMVFYFILICILFKIL